MNNQNASKVSHANGLQKHHFAGLDSLRGIAIILVMIGHFIPQAFPEKYPSIVSTLGGAGVLLFFYLSGFLIFNSLQSQGTSVFLIRRFFKLMPAYWLSVVVIFGMANIFGIGSQPSFSTVLYNLLMIQDVMHAELLSGVYWTLLIEAKFYLLMAIFWAIAGARRICWLLLALLVTNAIAFHFWQRGSVLVTYLVAFFPGIVAARLLQLGRLRYAALEYWLVGIVVVLNLYVFLPIGNVPQALYAVLFLGMMMLVLHVNMQSKILSFFGRISYSHYLFHTAIGYPLIDYMVDGEGLWMRFAALGTASICTVLIAYLSYHMVERSGVALGHELSKSWASRFQPIGERSA